MKVTGMFIQMNNKKKSALEPRKKYTLKKMFSKHCLQSIQKNLFHMIKWFCEGFYLKHRFRFKKLFWYLNYEYPVMHVYFQ